MSLHRYFPSFAFVSAVVLALPVVLAAQHAGVDDAATSEASENDPCSDEVHRASDYALGEWVGTVKVPEEDGTLRVDPTVTSEARLEPAADGCALVETRAVYRDGREPTRILTVRAYDPDSGRWHQFLVSSRPAVLRFRGEVSEGNLRFVTPRPGGEELVRVTDRRVEGGGFDRVIEASHDNGRSWILEDVVEYRSP